MSRWRRGFRDLLVGDAPVADLELAIDREHHQPDLALAVIGDGLGDGRALAGLEVFAGRILVRLPERIGRLAARDLGVRVHVDRDEILDVHGRASLALWTEKSLRIYEIVRRRRRSA